MALSQDWTVPIAVRKFNVKNINIRKNLNCKFLPSITEFSCFSVNTTKPNKAFPAEIAATSFPFDLYLKVLKLDLFK